MDFSHLAERFSGSPATALPLLFLAGVLTSFTPCIYPMIPITAAIVGGSTRGRHADPRARAGAHAHVRARPRARLLDARPLRRPERHDLRHGQQQSVAVLRDGEPAHPRGARHARRDPGGAAVVAAAARRDGGRRRAARRRVRHGRDERARRRALLRAGDGGGAHVGDATRRSAVLGFAYLFSFSLGMSALLVVVGVSSGTVAKLPRAGVWMVWIKRAFAIIMIGVAEYYLLKAGQAWI